jgi:hypothetical protein
MEAVCQVVRAYVGQMMDVEEYAKLEVAWEDKVV